MQRLLSLGTLGVIGWMGWMFLQGGGLSQIAVAPRGGQPGFQQPGYQQPNYQQSSGYQTPGAWQGTPAQQVGNSYPRNTSPQQSYQTPAIGGGGVAPPANVGGGQTIRIASFNIQVFGNTKANKSYVMHDLADIINQFDVVAIQEIRSKDEYLIPNFVQLVNQRGRHFDHVIGPRIGYTTSKEQYVFLFDTQKVEVDHQSVYTVGDPDGLLHREPLVATFRTRGVDPDNAFTFTLVNIHTDPDVAEQELDVLAEVYRVVRRSSRGEDDIIILGDLNVDDRHLGRLGQLPGVIPLLAGVATNTRQTKQYDNLIIHRPSTTEYTGRSGVFDFMRFKNRSQKQALEISDHFPVWGEFSIYERDASGRIASRRNQYGR